MVLKDTIFNKKHYIFCIRIIYIYNELSIDKYLLMIVHFKIVIQKIFNVDNSYLKKMY